MDIQYIKDIQFSEEVFASDLCIFGTLKGFRS